MADTRTSKSTAKSDPDAPITRTIQIDPRHEPAMVEAILRRLAPRDVVPVVGNWADVQRMGAAVVSGGSPADGVQMPPRGDGGDEKIKPVPLEDLTAPGPVSVTADGGEALYGERLAQGERQKPSS